VLGAVEVEPQLPDKMAQQLTAVTVGQEQAQTLPVPQLLAQVVEVGVPQGGAQAQAVLEEARQALAQATLLALELTQVEDLVGFLVEARQEMAVPVL